MTGTEWDFKRPATGLLLLDDAIRQAVTAYARVWTPGPAKWDPAEALRIRDRLREYIEREWFQQQILQRAGIVEEMAEQMSRSRSSDGKAQARRAVSGRGTSQDSKGTG